MNPAPPIHPKLIVISDTTVAPDGLLEQRLEHLLSLARPGMVLVQLRDVELVFRARRALGELLMSLCQRHGAWLSVNDRIDLVVALGADGLHLGERSVSPLEARSLLPRAFISHACHDITGVHATGSNAALLSPIFAPRKARAALGVAALRGARVALDAANSPLSLYALGGVDASNAALCIESGATGVAVIGAALDGRDPAPLVQALGIAR